MDDDYDRLEREMAEQNERIAKLIATAEVVRPIKSSVPPEVLAADTKAGAHLRPGIVAAKDVSWPYWLDHLTSIGAREVRDAIILAGAMDAPSLWPMPGCALWLGPIVRFGEHIRSTKSTTGASPAQGMALQAPNLAKGGDLRWAATLPAKRRNGRHGQSLSRFRGLHRQAKILG